MKAAKAEHNKAIEDQRCFKSLIYRDSLMHKNAKRALPSIHYHHPLN